MDEEAEVPSVRHRALTAGDAAALDAVVATLVRARAAIASYEAVQASLMSIAMKIALERVEAGKKTADAADDSVRGRSSLRNPEMPLRDVAAEIAAAIRVSDRKVQNDLWSALELTSRFKKTHKALVKGKISARHADEIVTAGTRLDDDKIRRRYEREVLPVAKKETARRTAAFAKAVAEKLLPESLEDRHERAVEERCVQVWDCADGMSELRLLGSSAHIRGIHDRLTRMARDVKDADKEESRTMDQLRADLFTDLALSGVPTAHGVEGQLGAIKAEIHLTVPVLTLAGASNEPAMIDGVQPIDPKTALQLVAAGAGWDRVLTHPVSGAVLAVDRYTPSTEMKRFLRAVDQRCRFPGCATPARRCDLDHELAYSEGGETSVENLTDKCRRHHTLKHHTPWESKRNPDGTVTWVSPLGRGYQDDTPPRVTFTPDLPKEPAPF